MRVFQCGAGSKRRYLLKAQTEEEAEQIAGMSIARLCVHFMRWRNGGGVVREVENFDDIPEGLVP